MDSFHIYLTADFFGTAVWTWLSLICIVLPLLAFNLGFLHKGDGEACLAKGRAAQLVAMWLRHDVSSGPQPAQQVTA